MPKVKLTDDKVRNSAIPPKPMQVEIMDSHMPGMMLRVSYGGTRTFYAVRYVAGKARMHKLGRFPILSVVEARVAARKFLADPDAALKQQLSQETFEQVLDKFVLRHIKAIGLRSAKDYESRLRRHCAVWYNRPFEEIRRRDIVALLDQVEDEVSAKAANLLLAHISKLSNWYASRSDEYMSPVISGMKRHTSGARQRKLTDEEIRTLWNATADLGCYGAIVRMLLLTAQRREKIARMKWTDLSSDGVWTIATAPREKGNPGVLPLPVAALEIISARSHVLDNPYVFAAVNGPGPLNTWSAGKTILDSQIKISPWVLHDLRRTARSLMSRAGVTGDHSERVLGHKRKKAIEEVYDVYEYTDEKATALIKLEGLIQSIVNPPKDNVVPLRQQALPLN